MSRTKRQVFGRRAEWAVLVMLVFKGYRPLHRNWRGSGGEIDLVMRHRGETVFVEVKARSGDLFGGAVASFDHKKRRVLERAAAAYLGRHGLWEKPCRFDLVTVERRSGLLPWRIRHYQNAHRPDLGRQF
jgi:putative endonuclease